MNERQSNAAPTVWGIIGVIAVGLYLLIFCPVLLVCLILEKDSHSMRYW